MNLDAIKAAVDAGRTVHWANDGYRVIKDDIGQYLIKYGHGASAHYIGLTWRDGVTLNGKPSEFYLAPSAIERAQQHLAKNVGRQTQEYLEAILWAETDESTPSGGEPLDRNYGVEDFADESVELATKDLEKFYTSIVEMLFVLSDAAQEDGEGKEFEADVEAIDWDDVGHDFWLTRVGHGTGFWDKPEKYTERFYKSVFDHVAKSMGERYVTVGDDGKIYVEGGGRGFGALQPWPEFTSWKQAGRLLASLGFEPQDRVGWDDARTWKLSAKDYTRGHTDVTVDFHLDENGWSAYFEVTRGMKETFYGSVPMPTDKDKNLDEFKTVLSRALVAFDQALEDP